jgi:ribonuclease-3
MSDARQELLEALQERLGYRFEDPSLLARALTHRSWAHERQRYDDHGVLDDNERLEFLGDGVLYLLVSEYLFEAHPGADEGLLSKRRRLQIRGSQQTAWGGHLGLDDPALLLRGRISDREALRGEASRLEDAFEAVLGAVFLDGGYQAARSVLLPWISSRDARIESLDPPKGRLQEALQARGLPVPAYPVVDEGGPPHERWFEAEAVVVTSKGGEPAAWGRGRARSKRLAQTEAAREAWTRLVEAGLLDRDEVD